MLNTVATLKKRIFRLIDYVSIVGVIATIALLLGSCVPFVRGPYYQPQKSENTRSYRNRADNIELVMAWSDDCPMRLRSYTDGGSITLSLLPYGYTNKVYQKMCQIHTYDEPLVIEDLDTGKRLDIGIFQRVFSYGPILEINQAVDLVALIPGFAAVPVSERRYALSVKLNREFNGSLPDEVQIQVPDIQLGDRHIQLPQLKLKRYERSGEGWWYAPATTKDVLETTPAGKAFGAPFQTLVHKPADIWYEERFVIRIHAVFRGRPFTWSGGKRNNDDSEIFGSIFIEVLGDEPIRLVNDQVAWHVSGDKSDKLAVVDKSNWRLKMYTTTTFSNQLGHMMPELDNEDDGIIFDSFPKFLIVIPDFQPQRFRVTLPPIIDENGHEWPIQPIEYEYKSGGVGLAPVL